MGGSGGGSLIPADTNKLVQKLRESEETTQDKEHEATVDDFLKSCLTEFNDRNHEDINRHLDEIKKALEKDIEGTIDLLFGGSVAKHTYVDGLSDIDSLVILNKSELADGSPQEAKEYFADRLRERYSSTDIQVGDLAVTLRFSDGIEIQLLPAVSAASHIKIADRNGDKWARIRPKDFTNVLTKINQRVGQKVVPVIKLAKAIIKALPEKHQISGYHAESLAIEAFRDYKGSLRPREMLKHFFRESSQRVRSPILDRTGQSVHVDDYLGGPPSLERKIVADAFGRVSRRMDNADNARSVEAWRKLFGD